MSSLSSPPDIVLASASPRRKALLLDLGLSFTIQPAAIDETPLSGESAPELAERLSRSKAEAVAGSHPASLVLAADTVVSLDGRLLEKPRDTAENEEFLALLSGRQHQVITGHALRLGKHELFAAPVTQVTFRRLTAAEIRRYAAGGEGSDKAGGYALQGAGAALIEEISGCFTNVIGLSLPAVIRLAAQLGVAVV
jgi:septum formation protein